MSDPDEWFLEWVKVNLPWSEVPGSWVGPPEPDADAEERVLLGLTYQELAARESQRFREARQAELSLEGLQDEDRMSEVGRQAIEKAREECRSILNAAWDQVAKLPCWVAWAEALEKARAEHRKTYFAAQAEPGMIVETREGEHFLIGDVSVSGGVGTEHFPLRDKFIVRYCRLHPYPLDKRYLTSP